MEKLKQKVLSLLKEEFGEYSYFEVKKQVAWDTLEKKAEFIKDIQSLCNSLSSEPNRYLVIGYDKHKKTFEEVSNYIDFDDGKLVSMLSAYLDPEITFTSHTFITEDNKHFVVIEFTKDMLTPPHLIKKEIRQQGKDAYLNLGEMWIKGGGKGGSSSKRRATRSDIFEMFDLYIEQQTEKRTQIRVTEVMKTKQVGKIAQELILPKNFDISLIYEKDEIFLNIIKQLILGEKSTYLRELVENIRQNILFSWKKTGHDVIKPEDIEKLNNLVYDVKINQIQPSIRKIVLLGVQLIKTHSYPLIFGRLLQILTDFYPYGYRPEFGIPLVQNIKFPNENLSFSLSSIESMTAFNLLGAYAVKIGNTSYLSKIINLRAKWEDGFESRLMIFQHVSGKEEFTAIPELRNSDGKTYKNLVNFYSEKGNYLIPVAFDDKDDASDWVACFDLVKEFNSQALIYNWEIQKKLREEKYNKERSQLSDETPGYKINELRSKIFGEYDYWRSPYTYFSSILNLNSKKITKILERFIELYRQKDISELKNYFVNDKHNQINYEQFDKFILKGIEDIQRQRDQSYHFASLFGWFGKDVNDFIKTTSEKYNLNSVLLR